MPTLPGEERPRLLDPVDRISEILFGLIMAVTIVGSLRIATAGQSDMLEVAKGALGCNVAWGFVDAVMYLVRTAVERSRHHALARRIVDTDAATGCRVIRGALPEHLDALIGDEEVGAMRRRLLASPLDGHPVLRGRDFSEALAVFAWVVVATFPVVAPFLLANDATSAMSWARGITIVMLFAGGTALARYAGYPRPLRGGVAMTVFGAVLILVVMALGG